METAKDRGFWRHPAIRILTVWAFRLGFVLMLLAGAEGYLRDEAWERFCVAGYACCAVSFYHAAPAASGGMAKVYWAGFVLAVLCALDSIFEPLL